MSDMELYRDAQIGDNTQCVDADGTIRAVLTHYVNVVLTDGGTAATATAEHVVHTVLHRCQLSTGPAPGQTGLTPTKDVPKLVTGVAVTADATNNMTVTLARRRAGGAAVPFAAYTSNVAGGSTVLWTPKDLAITGDFQFEIGDVITCAVTKAGSGVAHSSATVPSRLTFGLEKN